MDCKEKKLPPHLAEVARVARRAGWFVPWRIAHLLSERMSESSLTRRLRELRSHGYTVELKRQPHSPAYLYRVRRVGR